MIKLIVNGEYFHTISPLLFKFRFESKLNLQHEQRTHFTSKYAEATTHIISENFRQYPITFGLQKDSMFTEKFGEIMR